MKHTHVFLLLALTVLLCRCTKQNQTAYSLTPDKTQATARELKLLKVYDIAENDSATAASPISQKFFDEVAELTKPLQEQLGATFKELNAGLYESYQKDLQSISMLNSDAEREKHIGFMKEKYYSFLREGWEKTGIDDASYQMKITNLLPRDLRELIRFDVDFLNFYFDILRPPGSTTWIPRMKDIDRWEFDDKEISGSPKPPANPCQLVEGKIYYPNFITNNANINKTLCADAAAYGQYSNGIYARANTWPLWGWGIGSISLASNLQIPVNACTKLRVRKTTQWQASLYAFTFYGHLTVSKAAYNTGFTAGNVIAVAPLIWYHERNPSQTIVENYVINKGDFRAGFGADLLADVKSEGLFSNGSAKTSLAIPSWTITELCCE